MILHRLTMQAFGPFAETTTIDFDHLAADGLFLLHGHTGAGKTTVLDAIAFSLYGKVPGARQEGKRLHSDHARPEQKPVVELEATFGEYRVRVKRSPQFERPAGSGTRTEPAKASLTWLDVKREQLTRIGDVNSRIARLVGMNAEQFFQVVLLPQGDFAQFLRTDNIEREKLLEKLFATSRFGAAEKWLADKRRSTAAEVDAHLGTVQYLLGQVGARAGMGRVESVEPEDAVAWTQDLLDTARTDSNATAAALTACRCRAQETTQALETAKSQHDLHRRRHTARDELAAHQAATTQRTAQQHELEQAVRAEPLAAALAEAEPLVAAAHTAETALRTATESLAGLASESASADIPEITTWETDLDTALGTWTSGLGALQETLSELPTLDRLTSELDDLHSQTTELDRHITTLTGRHGALPSQISAAEDKAKTAAEARAALPGLRAEVERLQSSHTAATRLVEVAGDLDEARRDYAAARDRHQNARDKAQDLRERRLAGMAAELAGALVPDTPCVVCGSRDHPKPAEPTAEAVSAAAEKSARTAERTAETQRDAALAHLTSLERESEALSARAGATPLPDLTTQLATAETHYTTAQELAAKAEELSSTLEDLRQAEDELQRELREAYSRKAALTSQLTSTETRRTEVSERLRHAAGADSTVVKRQARLQSLIAWATELRTARDHCRTVTDKTHAAFERIDKAFHIADVPAPPHDPQQSPHSRLAAYRVGIAEFTRTPERRAELESALKGAETRRAHATAVLAEPDLQSLPEIVPDNLAELEIQAETATAAVEKAIAAHVEATSRVTGLEELSGQLWTAVETYLPAKHTHEELKALADVVAGMGANNRRISLSSYVLAARLEEVAIAASARLRRMSSGRYEFVHSDKQGPHGKRGGLGLDIRDDYTGHIRPAKTLSGGETFLASLALALGLADTVTAESGGIVLKTLFIDEGFGSLDAETLETVMDVLDSLRAGGRAVGVVSHVDEMRSRIPSRLHVIRGRTGSRIRATVA